MKNAIGKNVLINTEWFTANDGAMYRCVWGELKGVHNTKDLLGFDTSRAHANWVYEVGNMFLMGCKVSSVILSPERPSLGEVEHVLYDATNGVKKFMRPNEIWISE